MNTPTISKLLDYVRVQMAAEALYIYDAREPKGSETFAF